MRVISIFIVCLLFMSCDSFTKKNSEIDTWLEEFARQREALAMEQEDINRRQEEINKQLDSDDISDEEKERLQLDKERLQLDSERLQLDRERLQEEAERLKEDEARLRHEERRREEERGIARKNSIKKWKEIFVASLLILLFLIVWIMALIMEFPFFFHLEGMPDLFKASAIS